MKIRALLLAAVAALALRALLSLRPSVLGFVDPLLAVAVVAALPGRLGAALGAGLLTGLLEDAWTGGWFGQHALTHTVIAYLLAWLAGRVDLTRFNPALAALVLASVGDWGLQLGLAVLFDRPLGDPPGISALAVAAMGTTICGLLVRGLALKATR